MIWIRNKKISIISFHPKQYHLNIIETWKLENNCEMIHHALCIGAEVRGVIFFFFLWHLLASCVKRSYLLPSHWLLDTCWSGWQTSFCVCEEHMVTEVAADVLEGFCGPSQWEWQSFPMTQGVLLHSNMCLLLSEWHPCYRSRRIWKRGHKSLWDASWTQSKGSQLGYCKKKKKRRIFLNNKYCASAAGIQKSEHNLKTFRFL